MPLKCISEKELPDFNSMAVNGSLWRQTVAEPDGEPHWEMRGMGLADLVWLWITDGISDSRAMLRISQWVPTADLEEAKRRLIRVNAGYASRGEL